MKLRFAFALAASITLAAPGAAFASVYDARTLGMGGSSIGYSGNASLAYWNPASVGMSRSFGLFLPTVALSFSNNLLSPSEAMSLSSSLGNIGKAGASGMGGSDNLFTRLGSSQGLNLRADTIIEPIGFSVGQVGPGNLAFRAYGHVAAMSRATLSQDFAGDLNGLFVQGGMNEITSTINDISKGTSGGAANAEKLKADVEKLKGQLNQYMGSFIKRNGAKTSVKELDLTAVTSANAAFAGTYSQPVPLKIAALPEAELTLGVTGKIFAAPPQLASAGAFALPGASNASISPLGGGMGANVNLNIDKQVTDLVDAIDAFQKDQNLATSAELASKTGAFMTDGLANSKIGFYNAVADSVGGGLDLGAAMKINKQVSVGLALINPLLFWNAKRTTYQYDFSGNAIVLKTLGSTNGAFYEAEPFVARAGAAWQPDFGGNPVLGKGWLMNLGMEAPILSGQTFSGKSLGIMPSVNLGVEKLFGPIALRLGTQQGGISPLYTAGLGVQTSAFQLNLGLGMDNAPMNAKAIAGALSVGAGF